jgi:carotenoid cleavage dioxygenase-like enzyme
MFVVSALPYGDGSPLFTGDGMIYRLSFGPEGVALRTRLVRTDCFLLDEAAAGMPGLAFQNSNFVRLSAALGARNFANTALIPVQDGRLLAAYDAGRPWEIDPDTLETITPVGLQSTWRPFLPAITPGLDFCTLNMVTAHPCFDPDEHVTYMTNYATPVTGLDVEPFLRVVWWDGSSEPLSTTLVDEDGAPALIEMSVHQLQVTRHHIVILDGAFQIEPEQISGQDVTRAQKPVSVLWIARKDALVPGGATPCVRVEIPIESAHFLVDRDDSGDRIRVLLAHQNSADPSEWVRASDTVYHTGAPVAASTVGMMAAVADRGVVGRYLVDVTPGQGASVVDEQRRCDDGTWALTLWSQDERAGRTGLGRAWWSSIGFDPALLTTRIAETYADHPHRQLALADLPREPIAPRLVCLDQDTLTTLDQVDLPLGHLPMSPTFVPRAGGGRDDGYLVLFCVGPEADEVWIYDAGDLAAGPRCRLRHADLDVAFTLHSTWLPELRRHTTPAYRADRAADYGPRLEKLTPEAQALARAVLGL